MSSWLLIIFVIGLSVTLGDFPSRFLKCFFHICICSSWQAAFSLVVEMLFLLLTSFIVCYTKQDCLSSIEFLISLIWPWMYSICSFWYVLISLLCAFLSESQREPWLSFISSYFLVQHFLSRSIECHSFWYCRTDLSNNSPWKIAFWWEWKLYILWECIWRCKVFDISNTVVAVPV